MSRWHRPLMVSTGLMSALAVVTAVALVLDDRTLDGMPVWAKPLKFAMSVAVYSFTWAWLLSLQRRERRWGRIAGTVLAVAGVAEVAVITFQAARAHRSHFNAATPFDAVLFGVMGMMIIGLMVANVVAAVAVLLDRQADGPSTWAVRFGLAISTLGLASGGLMLGPRPGQSVDGGVIGAHTVAAADGGPGLPLLGWSTVAGDLRVPHFVGMHALQLLPLLPLALAALSRRFPALAPVRVRQGLTVTAGVVYAGVFGLVLWQAERGQSLVHPDGLTLAAAGILAVLALGGVAWSFRARAPRQVALAVPAPAEAAR
ncbi:hypothetical protein [Nonomuraea roseoviolacea]|uniref:Uncharacterized protein n=1 Tax=Nonomuraea roseoviolacea subsp. carminata TaxID=160689 RepID=A0ABT1JSC4_9ACTN|nr:hypothetical protein [Nonomuraea roseoviolacea]MCP2344229.1 hypothetical protein [Nonomuraea roseoviolacea subsp. carminata]